MSEPVGLLTGGDKNPGFTRPRRLINQVPFKLRGILACHLALLGGQGGYGFFTVSPASSHARLKRATLIWLSLNLSNKRWIMPSLSTAIDE